MNNTAITFIMNRLRITLLQQHSTILHLPNRLFAFFCQTKMLSLILLILAKHNTCLHTNSCQIASLSKDVVSSQEPSHKKKPWCLFVFFDATYRDEHPAVHLPKSWFKKKIMMYPNAAKLSISPNTAMLTVKLATSHIVIVRVTFKWFTRTYIGLPPFWYDSDLCESRAYQKWDTK